MFNGHHFVLHLSVKATQTSATILLPYDFQEIEKLRVLSALRPRDGTISSLSCHINVDVKDVMMLHKQASMHSIRQSFM